MEEKPQGLLISVETGQVIPATLMHWPLDDMETDEAVTEPAEPLRFTQSFTLKMPKMKATQRKKFLRIFKGKRKLPRKLKKGGRHLEYSEIGDFSIETKDRSVICKSPLMHISIKKGYPHTKWVRKAIAKIQRSVQCNIEALTKKGYQP